MLALLMAALLLLDAPAGYLYGTFPNISELSLPAGLECSKHGVWGQPQSPPGTHRGPRGWLWSLSAASALLHNPQLVLLHPSTAQTGIDPTGNRVQPTHPRGGTGALHIPLLHGSCSPEPWREDMKIKLLHSKKKKPTTKKELLSATTWRKRRR